jgi:hypothetical protein
MDGEKPSKEELFRRRRNRTCGSFMIPHWVFFLLFFINFWILFALVFGGTPVQSGTDGKYKLGSLSFLSINGTEMGTAEGKIWYFGVTGWCVVQDRQEQMGTEKRSNGPGTIPGVVYSQDPKKNPIREYVYPIVDPRTVQEIAVDHKPHFPPSSCHIDVPWDFHASGGIGIEVSE